MQKKDNNKFKNNNNHNCQKIKLYGSLTTKELKKKHSSRPVRGVEMGSRSGEDAQQGSSSCVLCKAAGRSGEAMAGRQAVPHLHADKLGGTTEDRDRPRHPGCRVQAQGNKTSKTLTEKNLWGLRWWEKLPASQESTLERPTGFWNVHKPTHPGISTRKAQFDCG